MSRQQKHEQTVLQLLKRRVTQASEEEGSAAASSSSSSMGGGCTGWMSGLQQVNKCPTMKELQDGLLKAVRYSPIGMLMSPVPLQLATACFFVLSWQRIS